ncbi:MAG: hypothetical protein Tsb0013_13780 [Phycisphaerales bacterium]
MPDAREISVARDAYERAFACLRTRVVRWDGPVCALKRGDEKFTLDTGLFAGELEKRPSAYRPETLALLLADTLGLPADEGLVLSDIVNALPLLRPRFVRSSVLEGPGRALVRREVGPDLLLGISLGRRTMRNFVTTRILDAWGMTFDEMLDTATEELLRRFTIEDIRPLESDPRVLAVTHPREPAASLALGIDRMVDGLDEWPGALLGKPSEDTLLLVPLDDASTIKDLGAIIESTYRLANEHTQPLSPYPCWLFEGSLHTLGLRMEEAAGGGRRATVETNHPHVAHLLRVLSGEDTGGPPPADDPGPFG